MTKQKTALILLRLGIAFTFFYAAIASFLNPNDWIGFFPIFLRNSVDVAILNNAFSFYELVLGFWLLSGRWPVISASFAALSVLGIIIFNFGVMDIIFRDVAILFSALALAILSSRLAEAPVKRADRQV